MDGSKRRLERLACDRCHRQKLRCSRASSQSRACQRCVKAGERCTYSPPLRLGRPVSSNKQDKNGGASPPTLCESRHSTPATCVAESIDMATDPSVSLRMAGQTAAPSASPTIVAMTEPQPTDYLMTSASAMDKAFLLAAEDLEADYRHGISLAPTMMLDMDHHEPQLSATATCDLDDFYLYSTTPYPPETLIEDGPQLGFDSDPERQLLALQQTIFEAVSVDDVDGLKRTIGVTARASNMLLGIITALTSPSPSPSCSSSSESPPLLGSSQWPHSGDSGTTTILLVTACYARILHNVDAIATRLHDLVSCSDHEALLALPSIQMGTFIPATLVAPAIQTSVLVQLLSQSVCEIEKRLPSLTSTLLVPPALARGGGTVGRSNVADMVGAVYGSVVNLETHVKSVLSVTLDLLSRGGSYHREHRGYAME
ncbi:hypothetical protein XA68_12042 [Ophiocordyceps unilateralis]|uniref:Zn(2)-C6 fungal-type domain-containing protein n=1 Tax=Ophiocordyceps unilateralis TaxID=268505 RepID=A0A2A9PEM9_OPHUN|nr:hypothetical protein XA68_12042 [Ophiocordyceps unilateralis]